jgi:hypothetical protein
MIPAAGEEVGPAFTGGSQKAAHGGGHDASKAKRPRPAARGRVMTRAAVRPPAGDPRHPPALTELFLGGFRRDLLAFFPRARFEAADGELAPEVRLGPPNFCLREVPGDVALELELFGARYRISDRETTPFTPQDRRMMRAIGAVLAMRYHQLFQISSSFRLELYRGGSEDHYVAAFLEPSTYEPAAGRPSRIAATIQALRIAALSTYENHRVSTGALLVGPLDDPSHPRAPAAPDALPYGVELTGLKSVHRLCDGKRTLFLVDRAGRLAEIVDITRWAAETPRAQGSEVPCARAYQAHAQATCAGGHMCLVLSPNQEIKIFSSGSQVFAFAHGRWRILDPQARYALWENAVAQPALARVLFQAALDLAEMRQGGLFVVVSDPAAARGSLIAPHDLLSSSVQNGPPPELAPRDPLAKRALHYLARGRNATALDPPVLEALASLDGALVTDRTGRILAFGAILRHDTSDLPALTAAEGARTTAACVASRFGPVLKVSEDGVVSCYLNGARAWDL